MDLKELMAFKTILQEGTFSKAAEKLNYAQSTITNQIQRLEKEWGVQLFKRGWDAELTPAGRILAAEIDGLLEHWAFVSDQAKAIEQEELGTIRIGVIESMLERLVPQAWGRFRKLKPRMTCEFISGNTDTLVDLLKVGQLDFALCGEPMDASLFHFEVLDLEQIAFIVDEHHPLAQRRTVAFTEVLEYPCIVGGRTCLYYLQLSKQLSREKMYPSLHTVTPISAIPGFVRNSDCIGIVLDSTSLIQGVRRMHVHFKDKGLPVGVLQLRNHDYLPASRSLLLRLIREEWVRSQ